MCDHCGVVGPVQMTTKGVQVWAACPTCHPLAVAYDETGDRPKWPFGAPIAELQSPGTTREGWVAYRMACEGLGYTLYTAETRVERDALHDTWGRMMTYIARMGYSQGTLKDRPRQQFFVKPFLLHLMTAYGEPPKAHPHVDTKIQAMIGKKPLRDPEVEAILATIPPPRQGARHG